MEKGIRIVERKDKNGRNISILSYEDVKIVGYTPHGFRVTFVDSNGINKTKTEMLKNEIESINKYFIKGLQKSDFCNPFNRGFYITINLSISFFDEKFIKNTPKKVLQANKFIYTDSVFSVDFLEIEIEKTDKKYYLEALNSDIQCYEQEIKKIEETKRFYNTVEYKVIIEEAHSCHHHDLSCPYNNDYPFDGDCEIKDFYIKIDFLSKYEKQDPFRASYFNYDFYLARSKKEVDDFYKKSIKNYKKTGQFLDSPVFTGIETGDGRPRRMDANPKYEIKELEGVKSLKVRLLQGDLTSYFSIENAEIMRSQNLLLK